jgi:hypothetical protein
VLTTLARSRQLFVSFLEAGERSLHANPLLGRLEDAERRGLSGLQLVEEALVHGELGDTPVGESLQETHTSRVCVVDPQAHPRRQQHP